MERRFILISGCSGGGKSTLLEALSTQGFLTTKEPGRRIVDQEISEGGHCLPWLDLSAFAKRAMALAESDLAKAMATKRPVFFDRGTIDAAVALQFVHGGPLRSYLSNPRQYHRRVLIAPPWPEIFTTDRERRHSFRNAEAEYKRLIIGLAELGYETVELPKAPVDARVDFVRRLFGGLIPNGPSAR